jgi:V8-like Glu-specific endopeptidase
LFRLLPIVAVTLASLLASTISFAEHQFQIDSIEGDYFTADDVFPPQEFVGMPPMGQGDIHVEGMLCCGVDERVQVTNTDQYPWRTISYLERCTIRWVLG